MKTTSKRSVKLTEPLDPSAYLTKQEVAKRLGLHPKTVSEWANSGRLPAYRFGQFLRFRWDEVQAHAAQTLRLSPKS